MVSVSEDPFGTHFRWAPGGSDLPCAGSHGRTGGTLDESARRLSHPEYSVAAVLSGEGHDVRSQREPRAGGRTADLTVCGSPVEVKSFATEDERDRAPTDRSVYNKLVDACGQARNVFLMASGSDLTPDAVQKGVARFATSAWSSRLDSVRAVGDGFDLSWGRGPGLDTRPLPGRCGAGTSAWARDRPGAVGGCRSPLPAFGMSADGGRLQKF